MNSPAKSSDFDRRAFLKGAGIAAVAGIGSLAAPRSTRAAVPGLRPHYGMLIDLRKCTGCHACSVACKAEFDVPLGATRSWVEYIEKGSYPNVRRSFLPRLCNHCSKPQCVAATDVMLIGFELMVIFLFIMYAQLTIGGVKEAVAVILPGGDLAVLFWVGVVLIGLLIPALIELYYVVPKLVYHRGFDAPRIVDIGVSGAVLLGGFLLRYVVLVAGQVTGPVGI